MFDPGSSYFRHIDHGGCFFASDRDRDSKVVQYTDPGLRTSLIKAKSELRVLEYLLQEADGSEQVFLFLCWSDIHDVQRSRV